MLLLPAKSAQAASLSLDAYDPLGPLDDTLDRLFEEIFVAQDGARKTCEKLWRLFEQNKRLDLAEWAVQFVFLWWRDTPLGAERIKVARIGQRMAASILAVDPESVPGLMWRAAFEGFEALSRGVLDSLQVIPTMLQAAEKVDAIKPDYLYGLPALLMARVYFKAPPFPVSRGDLKKSLILLEKVRPLAEKKFATWHLFYAEALYLNGNHEVAFDVIANWENSMQPSKRIELVTIGMTRIDMAAFKQALESGKYDRYLWDAFMIPVSRDEMKAQFSYLKKRYVTGR